MNPVKTTSLLALVVMLWWSAASGQTFIPAYTVHVGSSPQGIVAITNYNGHGAIALVCANYADKTLTVLTNNGAGILVSNTSYATPFGPECVVAADVNNDGSPDLIYACSDNDTVTVLTNNGSGIFGSNAVYNVPGAPYDFVAADVNGDGKIDLIVADYSAAEVTVLTNNGTGKFVSSGSFPCGGTYPRWITVADFNGDGKPDLAVADYDNNPSSTLEVMTNSGTGTFVEYSSVAVAGYAYSVATADVNGDGKPDLISSAGSGGNALSVCTNNGNGIFPNVVNDTIGPSPGCLVVATNVNGDGKLELICVNNDNSLTVLTNNGSGLFAQEQNTPLGTAVYFIAVADVNGDGKPDLIIADIATNTLTILTNASISLNASLLPSISSFSPTNGMVGTNVVVTGTNFTGTTAVYFNSTTASFIVNSNTQITTTVPANATTGPISVVTPNGIAVSTTNFMVVNPPLITSFSPTNGMVGTNVVITGAYFTNATGVYFNGASASFTVNSNTQITATVPVNATTGPITVATPYGTVVSTNNFTVVNSPLVGTYPGIFAMACTPAVGNEPQAVAVVTNFNGHGVMALVSANYMDKTLTVLTNNGGGIFVSNTSYTLPVGPVYIATADVNGDGKPDLIYSSSDNDTVTVLTNNGSGVFGSNAVYSVDGKPFNFVAADVNGDGRPDLIAGGNDTGYLTVLTNNNDGSGKFTLSGNFTSGGGNIRWLAVADFNGDGRPDLAVSLNGSALVLVFTNNGGGTFNFASSITVGGSSLGVAAADVNGDGKPDIISSGGSSGNVLSVCTNNGNGTFTNVVNYTTGSEPTCVIAADVNGDGKPDLICANSGDYTLTVLTNNGSGGYTNCATLLVGLQPSWVTAADVNGDGRPDLVVVNSGNTLSVLTNTPDYPIAITGFSPINGIAGATVIITGTNLFSVISVLFDGIPASFTINSAVQITATVPFCCSGPVILANASWTVASSTNFNVPPSPAIISSPTQTALASALCNSSNITFAIDGTIAITNTLVISSDTTLDGTGHNVTISGSYSVGVFQINGGHVTLRNLTIANGYAPSGGGLLNQGGTVTIINCTFSNNVAVGLNSTNAGGMNGASGTGGAICNNVFLGGMTVVDSTFVNNTAIGGTGQTGSPGAQEYAPGGYGGAGGSGLGGGIYNGLYPNLIITNCTFYNNQAIGGTGGTGGTGFNGYYYQYVCGSYCCEEFFGCEKYCDDYCYAYDYGGVGGSGGVGGYGYGGNLYNNGSMYVINSTFAGGAVNGGTGGTIGTYGSDYEYNGFFPGIGAKGGGAGGNIVQGNGGSFIIKNCIVANPGSGGNFLASYPITDGGNNLSSDASLAFTSATSVTNSSPNLGPLAANGGPTLTMALLPASPAVRAGTTNGAPATDQRGQARKSLQIDMGAYETPVTPSSIQPAVTETKSSIAGMFKLAFTNTPGTSFSVWSATNLMLPFTSWTLLGFPRETAPGQFQFSDPSSTNNPLEFYRVSSP